ncbi:DUF2264 domain-containing protein [Rhodococcus pyridinivorans]|uniref:DUF2264 domain-containing protein n=1 Tax=Rhodococcus pyridinivorans TaxID=103816 RepID=UPI000B1009EF|nr:DUF2264 domain-containing protein [Rhodococcus pyridinivorans]QXF82809.1 DUF2264 domain-containing protein [Rhodococcus pyridinivorans]
MVTSKWGRESDAYERFSRTLLLSAFRFSGDEWIDSERNGSQRALAGDSWFPARIDHMAKSVNPSAKGGWWRLSKTPQSIVETASLALAIMLRPKELWEPLDDRSQQHLAEWLRFNLTRPVSNNNWVIFPKLIAEALVSVGAAGPECAIAIDNCEMNTESWYVGDGWYTDGPGRTLDYYNAWAFNFYLPLSAHIRRDDAEVERYSSRLSEFLSSLYGMVDPKTGGPVYFGRSLTYRFGIAAPFALAGVLELEGESRRAGRCWSQVVEHFVERGALNGGELSIGWFGPDSRLRQRYSGHGSPYWACKAFASLMIPQESTFWADPDGADCDSDDDDLMPAGYRSRASFLISNQRGVSTLFNHGTDHQKKHRTGYFIDDPLYARGAYSSRTVPNPRGVLPNNTFVIERDGRWTERGAVEPLRSGDNWVQSRVRPALQRRLYGSRVFQYGKMDRFGPRIASLDDISVVETTVMLDYWAVQFFFVSGGEDDGSNIVKFGCWPIPDDGSNSVTADNESLSAQVKSQASRVQCRALFGFDAVENLRVSTVSPLSSHAYMTVFSGQYKKDGVYGVAVNLSDESFGTDEGDLVEVVRVEDRVVTLNCNRGSIRIDDSGVYQ